MRSLVRPCLFAIARLGLFLAVTAWVIHSLRPVVWWQWNVPGYSWVPADTVVLMNSDGLFCKYRYGSEFSQIALFLSGEDDGQEHTVFDALGVRIVDDGQDRRIVIRHWLIVAVFALFYAVLKWVYREQKEQAESGT